MEDRYVVQALIPDLSGEHAIARDAWTDIHAVPRQDYGLRELNIARDVASMARGFYVNVRIARRTPDGEDKIVR